VTVKFNIKGAAELERAMRDYGPRFANNQSGKALRAAAKPIVKTARALVPVRTGALKKSITTKLGRVKNGQRTIKIGFRTPASRYAHLVEYGTRFMAARPFMRPALDTGAQTALTEMQRVLTVGIEEESRKRGIGNDGGEFEGEP
jgi:HK97 gp10 family phage protein